GLGHVGGHGQGFAALADDQLRGLLGALDDAIDAQDLAALPGEEHGHGPAVADRFAGRLSGPHDDDGLAVHPVAHGQNPFRSGSSVWPASSCTPKVFSIIETWVYWAAVKTTSM